MWSWTSRHCFIIFKLSSFKFLLSVFAASVFLLRCTVAANTNFPVLSFGSLSDKTNSVTFNDLKTASLLWSPQTPFANKQRCERLKRSVCGCFSSLVQLFLFFFFSLLLSVSSIETLPAAISLSEHKVQKSFTPVETLQCSEAASSIQGPLPMSTNVWLLKTQSTQGSREGFLFYPQSFLFYFLIR